MANKKGAFKDLLLAALLAAFLLAFNERFFRLSAGIWRVGGFCLVPHFQHHRTHLQHQNKMIDGCGCFGFYRGTIFISTALK